MLVTDLSFATTSISTGFEERKVSLSEIIEELAYGKMRNEGLGGLRCKGSLECLVQRDSSKKYTLT